MKKKCAIIVPCYNEAGRLDLKEFGSFSDGHPDVTFIFVNDGSSDNTADILRDFRSNTRCEYLSLERNSGKAEAVRLGMKQALALDVDYIGFWDADLATPLSELERMFVAVSNDTVFISGCRLLRLGGNIRRSSIRHYIGRVFATAVSLHLDLPVYDTQCGAKLYAKECVEGTETKKRKAEQAKWDEYLTWLDEIYSVVKEANWLYDKFGDGT